MNRFAELLEALVYTTSRNRKLALLSAYLREVPDPDRGWARRTSPDRGRMLRERLLSPP